MDVPTPPTAAFTLNFESDAEVEDAERDRVDEPSLLNIDVPGVGNLEVIYVDSMAPTPPESETQSQIEDEVPQQQPAQQPSTTQIQPDEVPQQPAQKPSTNQMPDEVPSSKFNFFKF